MTNQYPIGRYQVPLKYDHDCINQWITDIKEFPKRLNGIVSNLDSTSLCKQYREGSWDVKTLIHHLADSHLHGYIRTKLILTEDQPKISTFNENEWVRLKDNENNIEDSLMLLSSIHSRWATILCHIEQEQLNRTMLHPDYGEVTLKQMLSLYAWHGNHHLEHIKIAIGTNKGE